ncbi:MAG: pyridoxal-phosphate dependent enzyme [Bacteroidetes bacterium]|nr:pyridoxal-phosphate dependent enzyme [Bacteroidota bacterium]
MFILPSPIQQIQGELFTQKRVSVWVKRDDLIHPYVSGNKLRKLQGWIQVAKNKRSHTLVTLGGAYSNHLIATAYAASIFGFKSIGLIRSYIHTDNLVLKHCRLFGMEIKTIGHLDIASLESSVNMHYREEDGYTYIPMGGSGEPGKIGFKDFLNESNMMADYYIVAAGTGTSAIGLSEALIENGNHRSKVYALACVKDYSLKTLSKDNLSFLFEYVGKGFGKYDDNLIHFVKDEFQKTGIFFDPIYTAKAWSGLYDLITKDYFEVNSKIIFVHTGGLTGWWSL